MSCRLLVVSCRFEMVEIVIKLSQRHLVTWNQLSVEKEEESGKWKGIN